MVTPSHCKHLGQSQKKKKKGGGKRLLYSNCQVKKTIWKEQRRNELVLKTFAGWFLIVDTINRVTQSIFDIGTSFQERLPEIILTTNTSIRPTTMAWFSLRCEAGCSHCRGEGLRRVLFQNSPIAAAGIITQNFFFN